MNEQKSELEIYHPFYTKCLTDVWRLKEAGTVWGFLHGADMITANNNLVEEELRFLKKMSFIRFR